MAAVSKGETEGLVAITAQITLQQLIHISSENKGSKLLPMSLPHSIPAPPLCSTSHFPCWPQFLTPGRCPSILHRLLTRLQWISPMVPSRTSHLQAAPALLMGLGAAGPFLPCLCQTYLGSSEKATSPALSFCICTLEENQYCCLLLNYQTAFDANI